MSTLAFGFLILKFSINNDYTKYANFRYDNQWFLLNKICIFFNVFFYCKINQFCLFMGKKINKFITKLTKKTLMKA